MRRIYKREENRLVELQKLGFDTTIDNEDFDGCYNYKGVLVTFNKVRNWGDASWKVVTRRVKREIREANINEIINETC
tara:strand:- start:34558 stop:34791 length:234 start_codon:yes stop_codon:yes gene_type:complete